MSDEIDDLSFPNEYDLCFYFNINNKILSSFESANQYPTNPKRKTVTVQHIFKPLETNQFYMVIQPLQQALKESTAENNDEEDNNQLEEPQNDSNRNKYPFIFYKKRPFILVNIDSGVTILHLDSRPLTDTSIGKSL
ncbi:unnamed protein product [Rotaria sordida]|uniref:Uncharacterized protein n=1 Tax=Rotaria sordida TaxID=392033 RepID=A0A814U8D1_9BILA|nr:unnamed protein product [Rotaria sordida]CAF1170146.1 unnamed protein product [Rotaria sordida]